MAILGLPGMDALGCFLNQVHEAGFLLLLLYFFLLFCRQVDVSGRYPVHGKLHAVASGQFEQRPCSKITISYIGSCCIQYNIAEPPKDLHQAHVLPVVQQS